MALALGTRVKILGGMKEFIGRKGEIIDDSEHDGCTKMYRVQLDNPVQIEGVGLVTDDLWSKQYLQDIDEEDEDEDEDEE